MKKLSISQIKALVERGCSAESWDEIYVSSDFAVDQLRCVRMAGRVEIGSGARVVNAYVANYVIGDNAVVEDVTRLECRHSTSFANGVRVATINENGGRSISIYDQLSAQTAYLWAIYRHRAEACDKLSKMVAEYAAAKESAMGVVGSNARVVAARIIRECDIRSGATVDGTSLLECVTVMEGAYIGVDVKAREVIFAEDCRVDSGATLERVFVGERAIVASGFSAVDSLIFASSHLENGEAASIFAAPFTVSHHKATLLIAGLFSFFNAGSASNQSNHLFRSGAVHQAIHPRGCKVTSGSYIMEPAREGAFTIVKGGHLHHHDTSAFPFSYLIEDRDKRSILIPAVNLINYGTVRDMAKWRERDSRRRMRDQINFEEHNPYITTAMLRAVNTLHHLQEVSGEVDEYIWERVIIRKEHVERALRLYNKAIAASIGDMLSRGVFMADVATQGEWVDVAGAFVPKAIVDDILSGVESGDIAQLQIVDQRFAEFAAKYDDYVHTWAHTLLQQLMGREIDDADVAQTIEAARGAADELATMRSRDMMRDRSMQMEVGYGHDSDDAAIRQADFNVVRGL